MVPAAVIELVRRPRASPSTACHPPTACWAYPFPVSVVTVSTWVTRAAGQCLATSVWCRASLAAGRGARVTSLLLVDPAPDAGDGTAPGGESGGVGALGDRGAFQEGSPPAFLGWQTGELVSGGGFRIVIAAPFSVAPWRPRPGRRQRGVAPPPTFAVGVIGGRSAGPPEPIVWAAVTGGGTYFGGDPRHCMAMPGSLRLQGRWRVRAGGRMGGRWTRGGGRRVAARPRYCHCAVPCTEQFQRPLLGHEYLFRWGWTGWSTPGGRWGRARAGVSGRTRNRRGGWVATLEAGLGRGFADIHLSRSGRCRRHPVVPMRGG